MKVRTICMILLAAVCLSWIAFSSDMHTPPEQKEVITQAMQQKNTPQLIKALITQMKGELEKDYDRFPALIGEVEKYTRECTDPASVAILHSMTAEMYNQYYQQNRWNINRRTNLSGYTPDDIREWTTNLFTDKVKEELAASLLPAALLQQTPAAQYKEIMETGKDSPTLRPTLYDFLIARAIEIQPAESFYQKWEDFRQTQFDPKALLLVELEHLQYNYQISATEQAYKQYTASLDSLLSHYAWADYATEIQIARIQALGTGMYRTENRDSVLDIQYNLCKETISRYSNYERIGVVKNKLAQLEALTFSSFLPETVSPGDSIDIQLSYTNVTRIKVDLYESKQAVAKGPHPSYGKNTSKGKLVRTVYFTLNPAKTYLNYDTTLQIPAGNLGLYECVISVPDQKITASHILSVSRLATVYRTIDKQSEVLVTDRKSGQPIPQAIVTWYGNGVREGLKPLGSAQTDKDGLVVIPANSKISNVQATLAQDTACFYASLNRYSYDTSESAIHTNLSLFTDRGLHRPGQTVFFKGIAYQLGTDLSQVVANQTYTVILRDANYKEVATKQCTTNAFGSFNGEFVLPTQVLNGSFTITAGDYSTWFRVEEYKRPTFAIELDSIRGEVAFGDSVTIQGKVQTFSGVTLTEAAVTWRIIRRSFWLYRGLPTQTRQVAEGTTRVSADGTFSLSFQPEKYEAADSFQQFYTYETAVTVTDSKGETQETRSSFNVGDASLVLSTNLPDKIEKEAVSLLISAETLNEQPTTASGTWKIVLWANDKVQTKATEFKEGETKGTGTFTSGQPIDPATFAALPSGRYRLFLQAKDAKGRDVLHEQDVILYSKQDKRPPVFSHFWVLEEQTTCLPGEEAAFILGTSDKDAYILYEIFCGDKLQSRKRIKLTDENQRFSLGFQESWGDGAVASFTFVKDGELHYTHVNLLRKQPDKRLTLTPVTFRDQLVPGTKENWTFRLHSADSTTVDAEILASMYDASLDKLMPFQWAFSPVRSIWMNAPFFYTSEGFGYTQAYGNEELKLVRYRDYSYDRLNWQGVLYGGVKEESMGITTRQSNRMASVQMLADSSPGDALKVGYGYMMKADADESMPAPPALNQAAVETASTANGSQSAAPLQLRQNFNETAFFYPTLRTNEAGDVLIQFTLPESNTSWKFQAIAHTKDLKYGQLTKEVVTSKPFMVTPNLPRFLREDDQVTISTQLLNQLDKEITGKARLEFFDPATDKAIDGWKQPEQPFTLAAKSNGTASWTITTPKGISLVGCRIIAESADGSDGEQHLLPVLSNRILVTESTPVYMLQPGEKTIRIAAAKGSREPFRLTMELTANPVWYAVQALPTMTQPDNDNILSWFAAYYSNTLATYIASAHPRVQRIISLWTAQGGNASTLLSNLEKNEELKNILLEETPWVLAANNETEQKQRLALLFDMNRAANLREAALQRLIEQQTADGGWSWFKGFYTDRTITLSIVKGMQQLTQQQTIQWNDSEKAILNKAVAYLDNCIRKDFADLKKNDKQWQKSTPSSWQLTYLFVRSGVKDIALSADTQDAVRFYTTQSAKEWTKLSYAGKAETALLAQRSGDKATATAILAWLRKTATTSEELGMYWANNRRGDDFFNSPVDTHCLLMGAFNELSPDSGETDRMKQWLLNQKRTQNWGTVPSNINAIYTLLLTGSDWLTQENTLTAQWGSQIFTSGSGEAATGYIKAAVEGKEITSGTNTLVLRKEGSAPAWGAVYNQYFETLDKVNAHKGVLNVEKKLFVETNSGTERQFRPISANTPLRVGDKVIVRLTIRTDRSMDYVVLKDLRAGCFEPAQALSGYNYRDGVGYYQSPKDVSENFFFTHLPKGTFVLEYPVYVSRTGDYAGGISTIQCMYAPEFTSHTAGERIRVNN